jgi:hypothetical protein
MAGRPRQGVIKGAIDAAGQPVTLRGFNWNSRLMAKDSDEGGHKGGGKSAQEVRAERLAAALRENLRRRKAQSRRRAETAGPAGHSGTGPGEPPRKP